MPKELLNLLKVCQVRELQPPLQQTPEGEGLCAGLRAKALLGFGQAQAEFQLEIHAAETFLGTLKP